MSAVTKAASLFAALVDLILTGRNPLEIAKHFNIAFEELREAFATAVPHTWRGKCALAMASSEDRPDLLPQYLKLAGFEFQYNELLHQYHRAEHTCRQVRSQGETDIKLIMKADAFSFRVQQAACRLLRDIDRGAVRLEKSLAAGPGKPVPMASGGRKSPEKTHPTSNATEVLVNSDLQDSEQIAAGLTNEPTLATPQTSAVLLRHRHRIKNTSAKDRPALIDRLLAEEKSRQKPDKAAA